MPSKQRTIYEYTGKDLALILTAFGLWGVYFGMELSKTIHDYATSRKNHELVTNATNLNPRAQISGLER
jgi:hypothetical protein